MPRNLVLALCTHYKFDQIRPFVASLRNESPTAHLHLFVDHVAQPFLEIARAAGITVDNAGPYLELARYFTLEPFIARLFMYKSFLDRFADDFERTLITDLRDVIFQGDPFVPTLPASVVCAAEDKTIGACQINTNWITTVFGPAMLDELSGRVIACAGTTLGTSAKMRDYLDLMCRSVAALVANGHRDWPGGDQPIHNVLLWKHQPPFMTLDVNNQFFATLGHTPANEISVRQGRIFVRDRMAPIVHQYDRHPQTWPVLSEARFRF